MKTIKYISLALTLAFVLHSCEGMLDMEPQMDLSDKTALNSTLGLQSAIIGAYDRLQGGDLYGGRIWVAVICWPIMSKSQANRTPSMKSFKCSTKP
jgi:hypothetical protein